MITFMLWPLLSGHLLINQSRAKPWCWLWSTSSGSCLRFRFHLLPTRALWLEGRVLNLIRHNHRYLIFKAPRLTRFHLTENGSALWNSSLIVKVRAPSSLFHITHSLKQTYSIGQLMISRLSRGPTLSKVMAVWPQSLRPKFCGWT